MANILKVTPTEVNEKARAITTVKEHIETVLHDLDGRINTMVSSEWIGDAGNAYQNQFVLLYNQVIRSLDVIQQHANNLSQAANRYAEIESDQVSTNTGLDATNIF